MKKLTLALALCGAALALSAQSSFQNAVGLRLGYPVSASYKHFLDDANAIEAYAGFRGNTFYNFFNIAGAYQRHYSFGIADPDLAPLNWYWGAGASVYFFTYDFGGSSFVDNDFASTTFGLNGYIGLQYAFEGVPLELTLDWVPSIFVGNTFFSAFGAGYGGLGARYILGR